MDTVGHINLTPVTSTGLATFKDPMSGVMFTIHVKDGEITNIYEGGNVWYEIAYWFIFGLWIWYWMLYKLTYDKPFVYASVDNIKPIYLEGLETVVYKCPNTGDVVNEPVTWVR